MRVVRKYIITQTPVSEGPRVSDGSAILDEYPGGAFPTGTFERSVPGGI